MAENVCRSLIQAHKRIKSRSTAFTLRAAAENMSFLSTTKTKVLLFSLIAVEKRRETLVQRKARLPRLLASEPPISVYGGSSVTGWW